MAQLFLVVKVACVVFPHTLWVIIFYCSTLHNCIRVPPHASNTGTTIYMPESWWIYWLCVTLTMYSLPILACLYMWEEGIHCYLFYYMVTTHQSKSNVLFQRERFNTVENQLKQMTPLQPIFLNKLFYFYCKKHYFFNASHASWIRELCGAIKVCCWDTFSHLPSTLTQMVLCYNEWKHRCLNLNVEHL